MHVTLNSYSATDIHTKFFLFVNNIDMNNFIQTKSPFLSFFFQTFILLAARRSRHRMQWKRTTPLSEASTLSNFQATSTWTPATSSSACAGKQR